MQRLLKLKKVLKNSVLVSLAEGFKAAKATGGKFRSLNADEIAALERNGNRCEDWSRILVEPNFTPERIHNSVFMGDVRLPAFYGTLLLPGDVSFPTGIYDSLVHNCIVENALVCKVAMLSNVLVRSSAVVHNVGSLVSSGKINYMIGSTITVGNEMGARQVRVFPDITMDLVDVQLFHRGEPEVESAFDEQLRLFREETALPFAVVGKGAVVSNTNIVRNSWIGAHARIEGASKVRNSVILSSLEESTHVYDSVILENSNLQMGVKVHTGAEVQGSVLMSRVKVGSKAIVKSSIVAPCCHIEEGEVNSSYMGPLTQMHHHSLLIAALWPEGCGNIGYGANVGSNHTGRMPDQEVMPGQGMFFGLGVNVKFPANYRESPFTIIASGITRIGTDTFRRCTEMTGVNIPNTVTKIYHSAFHGCEKLTSVSIPNGVTTISQSCFSNCVNLQSVTIPVSVTKIDIYAFASCNNFVTQFFLHLSGVPFQYLASLCNVLLIVLIALFAHAWPHAFLDMIV